MSHFAEMTEEEKLAAEEARLVRHGSNANWNKVVTKVVSPRTVPKETVGPRVVVYWLDRQTGQRVVEPISVHLDGYNRLPIDFLMVEWSCKNIHLKDGDILLRQGEGGYSLQAMNPNKTSIEIYADDTSHSKRTHSAHVEIEYTTSIERPIIPGFGNQSAQSTGVNFCPHCGARAAISTAKFCSACGNKMTA